MLNLNPFKSSHTLSETEDLTAKVFAMKRDALARAKFHVSKGKEPAICDGKPGLSNYLRALRQICEEQQTPLPIRAMMDLSKQNIIGFAFTDEDFAVADRELSAEERAQLNLMEGSSLASIAMEIFLASGATLNSCTLASHVAEKIHLPQFSQIHDLTVVDLAADHQIILENGFPIDGVVIRMANGGVVIIAEDTIVRNCKISGNLEFHVRKNAMVNGLNAEGACLVNLTAEQGAALENVNLEGATVACGSNFDGAVLKNVNVKGANLANLDFTGATIIGLLVDDKTKMSNCLLDFSLELEDIKIIAPDGTVRYIQDIAELIGNGIKGKRGVKISVHGLGAILHQAMQAARSAPKPQLSSIPGVKLSASETSLPNAAPSSPHLKPEVQSQMLGM
jgi:uncharacterized protein YjbI with pentapeptide repeats